jgi:hypothetical protein
MSEPYLVKCLQSKFDPDNGMLVLDCLFEHQNIRRIVYFCRDDFHYHGNPVPDNEMHKTASLFKGKRFNLVVENDPELESLTPEKQQEYAATFNSRIAQEMKDVQEGLSSEEGQIQRKLGRLMDAGKLKLDAGTLLGKEIAIRAKLGNI